MGSLRKEGKTLRTASTERRTKAGVPTTFAVPDGTMQFLTIDGAGVLGGATASYGPVTLAVGSHVVAVQWTGSDGVTNMATLNVTAT